MSITEREKSWIYQQNRVTKLRGLITRPRSWRQAIVEAEVRGHFIIRRCVYQISFPPIQLNNCKFRKMSRPCFAPIFGHWHSALQSKLEAYIYIYGYWRRHVSPEEYKKKYEEIDKESEGIHDRQIDLDVPRCHQYNPALSSSAGHRKLKRILKAWVKYNPDYAYWQGTARSDLKFNFFWPR